MRVHLLGTGSADGWPNPFCDCASCASERRAGRARAPSAALVDGRVLIDCGPTAPHRAPGSSLTDVEHVLVTHGHPDHLHPAFVLTRTWVCRGPRLHVWAPPLALATCRPWLGPTANVELHEITAGSRIELSTDGGRYQVHALAAAHQHGDGDPMAAEAVLFVVTAPDGHRLLYATDTGPLPAATVAAVGTRVDLLLLDETFGDLVDHGRGHLDLATLPAVLADLRRAGVVDDRTVVAATHLSHHNPPTDVLRARLAPLGVVVPDDATEFDTHRPGGRPPGRTLVLGGARSGKSTWAEGAAAGFARVDYVATGGSRPEDAEWADRVEQHRARRPAHWTTHERTDVADILRAATAGGLVLVDCLTLWLTAVLDDAQAWAALDRGEHAVVRALVDDAVADLVDALRTCPADVVLVSNEVGLGVVPATGAGRAFVDLLGRVNAHVAADCADVVLLVAGRPIHLCPTSPRSGGHR